MRLFGSRRAILNASSQTVSTPSYNSVFTSTTLGFAQAITSPPWANSATITLWGAGGNSGIANAVANTAGSGGGGGASAILYNTAITASTVYYYSLYEPIYDPYQADVTLLMPMTGAIGAVPAVSEGVTNAVTLSHNGGSGTDGYCENTVTKWGTQAVYFAGGEYGANFLVSPTVPMAGDFTIEGWVYPTRVSGLNIIFSNYPIASGAAEFIIGINGGLLQFIGPGGTFISGGTVSTGQWYHVAWTRKSNVCTLWLNGVSLGTFSGYTVSCLSASTYFNIGNYQYETLLYNFAGYMQDVRITNGVARYTANFTPNTTSYAVNLGYSVWSGTNPSSQLFGAYTGNTPVENQTIGYGGTPFGSYTLGYNGANGTSFSGTTQGSGGQGANSSGAGGIGSNSATIVNAGVTPAGGAAGQSYTGNAYASGGLPQITVQWSSNAPNSNTTTYTSNVTGPNSVTVPAGAFAASIAIWAAGGNGAPYDYNSGDSYAGSGGGGGGAAVLNTVVTPGSVLYYTLQSSGNPSYFGNSGTQIFGANSGITPITNSAGAPGGTPYGSYTQGFTGGTGGNYSGQTKGAGGQGGNNGGAGGASSGSSTPAASGSSPGGGGAGQDEFGAHPAGSGGGPQITITWIY